jgi:hypothetical protein
LYIEHFRRSGVPVSTLYLSLFSNAVTRTAIFGHALLLHAWIVSKNKMAMETYEEEKKNIKRDCHSEDNLKHHHPKRRYHQAKKLT